MTKLALGTVQFGMDYGIANPGGVVRNDEIASILNYAKLSNVDMLDTAIAYGNSESNLGAIGVDDFSIVTKLPEVPENIGGVDAWIRGCIQGSLNRLNKGSIYGLLLHRPHQLKDRIGKDIAFSLKNLKKEGLVSKIGISIYSLEELNFFIDLGIVDIVQVPFSIIDQRLSKSGWLYKLKMLEIEVHVRSIFLQGLLTMGKNDRPIKFEKWSGVFDQWSTWLLENQISPIEGCMQFIKKNPDIGRVIVGVHDSIQFQELVQCWIAPQLDLNFPEFSVDRTELINPAKWDHLS